MRRFDEGIGEVAKLADDPDAGVRMNAGLMLGTMPGSEAALVKILAMGGSPHRAEAMATGLRGRELDFLTAVLKEPEAKKDEVVASGILPMLSACAMKDRRSSSMSRLLELAIGQRLAGLLLVLGDLALAVFRGLEVGHSLTTDVADTFLGRH